ADRHPGQGRLPRARAPEGELFAAGRRVRQAGWPADVHGAGAHDAGGVLLPRAAVRLRPGCVVGLTTACGRNDTTMCPLLVPWLAVVLAADAQREKYCQIKVVDETTGRGVPLVELETVNPLRYVTDSNGVVAFREPGLMGQSVFFHVRSHGYEFP